MQVAATSLKWGPSSLSPVRRTPVRRSRLQRRWTQNQDSVVHLMRIAVHLGGLDTTWCSWAIQVPGACFPFALSQPRPVTASPGGTRWAWPRILTCCCEVGHVGQQTRNPTCVGNLVCGESPDVCEKQGVRVMCFVLQGIQGSGWNVTHEHTHTHTHTPVGSSLPLLHVTRCM